MVERDDYPLYGIDRERGLFYICYIQERGYEMDLRQQLMDTVDKLDWNCCPPHEANFLKHNINKLLDDNKKLSEQLDNRERDVSTEDLREVLNYIPSLGFTTPEVYYKISRVISERESLSPKDMTVEEIQEELGYAIKVVGERV